ncbi:ABC transporter ATP-binding protein [soil metagenome]|jgi:ABC-2 type transport system ATP-binding protein|nr:ABC transporter ATP-binding protein [Gemmatimonadota bacterium]
MLQAIDLTKRYEDGLLALDHLNLTVHAGETFCLLGANGAGKSTAINLFLDFIRPTGGQAVVDGIEVAADPIQAKQYVAYVSENVMLYGNFTARQNLDFFARLAGRDGLLRDDFYMALRRVGLQEKAFEQRVKQFSKGMRQKVGIAVAIVTDAPNVILDEPTSGLDPKSAAELMRLLDELRDEGRAIFMSTHDVFRAKEHATRVGIMKEGRLVMVRTRAELEEEDLERLYLDYMEVGTEALSA